MKPNLDKLENLSDDQLKKISNDVDTIGIRKAAEQASKDTGRSIDKTCVQRLKERSIARRFLAESPDTAQAATEILCFAVTGRPDFSEATIKVLEETAFKLSLECADSEEEMKALNSITVMLARYRSASVRERMVTLQEQKLQFRRDEFEWKKSIQAARGESKSAVRASTASSLESAIQEDTLGPLAKTLDDVERRACAMFNQPSASPINSNQSSSRLDGAHESPTPTSSPSSDASRPYLQIEKNSETPSAPNSTVAASSLVVASLQGAPTPETLEIGPSHNSAPYLQTEKNSKSETSSLPPLPSVHPSETSAPSAVTSVPNKQSSIIDHQFPSAVPPRVKSHAIRRWRAHIPRPPGTPEPDGSWRDECPCGNPAPCSEHPELKGRVRSYKPQHPEYQVGLKEFSVPYYKPTAEEIGCTQEALDRSCDLFADNPKMKDPPHPVVDPFKQWLKAS